MVNWQRRVTFRYHWHLVRKQKLSAKLLDSQIYFKNLNNLDEIIKMIHQRTSVKKSLETVAVKYQKNANFLYRLHLALFFLEESSMFSKNSSPLSGYFGGFFSTQFGIYMVKTASHYQRVRSILCVYIYVHIKRGIVRLGSRGPRVFSVRIL